MTTTTLRYRGSAAVTSSEVAGSIPWQLPETSSVLEQPVIAPDELVADGDAASAISVLMGM